MTPREKAVQPLCRGPCLRSDLHSAWGSLRCQLQTTGRLGSWALEGCLPGSVAQRGYQNCPGEQAPGLTSQVKPHLRAQPGKPQQGESFQHGLGNPTIGSN